MWGMCVGCEGHMAVCHVSGAVFPGMLTASRAPPGLPRGLSPWVHRLAQGILGSGAALGRMGCAFAALQLCCTAFVRCSRPREAGAPTQLNPQPQASGLPSHPTEPPCDLAHGAGTLVLPPTRWASRPALPMPQSPGRTPGALKPCVPAGSSRSCFPGLAGGGEVLL